MKAQRRVNPMAKSLVAQKAKMLVMMMACCLNWHLDEMMVCRMGCL